MLAAGSTVAPPAKAHPGAAFALTRTTLNVSPASCEAATKNSPSWLNPAYTLAPRTASTGLSASSSLRSATENDQVRPKSSDRATIMSRLLFCSQEAYTVCRSEGSTTICGSNWPVGKGSRGREDCHESPLSLLTIRLMLGAVQAGQSGTA